MKNPDAAIERVLGGLGGAAVPEGLERRVVAAVRARAVVREAGFAGMRGWVLAGAAAALVLAVGIGVRGRRSEVVVERPVVNVGASVQAAHVDAVPARVVGVRRASVVRRVAVAGAGESLEMQEMRAASEVAPALPLTAEEKMLRAMAHRSDAVLMATAESAEEAAPVEQEKSLKPVFLPGFEEATEPAAAPVVEQTGSGDNE